jgi:hypothetical protein
LYGFPFTKYFAEYAPLSCPIVALDLEEIYKWLRSKHKIRHCTALLLFDIPGQHSGPGIDEERALHQQVVENPRED